MSDIQNTALSKQYWFASASTFSTAYATCSVTRIQHTKRGDVETVASTRANRAASYSHIKNSQAREQE